ncbi:hypothetical protein, partial [Kitasatospora sp. MBT66]|uniref:hypothetical protein n=1 Tax=Kitasatospora sp. MBT66 TaxID=1444769 RepID=UPI001A7E1093
MRERTWSGFEGPDQRQARERGKEQERRRERCRERGRRPGAGGCRERWRAPVVRLWGPGPGPGAERR